MSLSLRAWGCALGTFSVLTFVVPECALGQANKDAAIERGRALFERIWEPAPDAEAKGDGLGPLFNERSCVACHFLGGVGGAGPIAKNAELLTAAIPENPSELGGLSRRLIALHPAFGASTSIVLHRFSTDPLRYAAFRDGLLGVNLQRSRNPSGQAASLRAIVRKLGNDPLKTIKTGGTTLLLSERNTTPLFGAGMIDSISQADIEAVAVQQTKENPNITGRIVGRFGWRGQTGNLGSFIRGACAIELGLQVSTHAQAADPSDKSGQPSPRDRLDLTDRQCEDLTAFVAALPAPQRLKPADQQQAVFIRNGEDLFNSVGCATCHRQKLGKIVGIYSDLLVHDMGTNLMDPAPAPSTADAQDSSLYYGSGPGLAEQGPLVLVRRREWKTPPLWGLRDSGPYLHDGRADTVEEAIAYHGGEAANSVDRYLALPPQLRTRIVAFLATLAGPDPTKLPQIGDAKNRSAPGRKPTLAMKSRARN